MTTFDRINRRTHLYLGLFLLPWLFMYGLSSFLIIHRSWFESQEPAWDLVFEREYHHPITAQEDPRAAAQEILKDQNLEGAFWAQRPKPDELQIHRFSFWGATRLTYLAKDHKLRAERQRSTGNQAIIRMHFRGGYLQPYFWDKVWGLFVDMACVGILVWICSGLIMWWRLPRLRVWGAVALGGGLVSFLLLMWRL
jgi:hypothetical protein